MLSAITEKLTLSFFGLLLASVSFVLLLAAPLFIFFHFSATWSVSLIVSFFQECEGHDIFSESFPVI
jgi:hypothetical protein